MASKDGQTTKKPLNAPSYTQEQIQSWSDEQIKTVMDRAKEKGLQDMVDLFAAEAARRPLFNASKAKARRSGGDGEPSLENQIANRIAELAHDIAKTFDLSEATATRLSQGVKGFKAHKALGSDGLAKTGGLKKEGKAAIDRLTSYRVGDEIVSLTALQVKGARPESLRYLVRAPRARMPRGLPFGDVMPELKDSDLGKAAAHFMAYEEFDEAAGVYRDLISQLAPKRD